MSDRIDSAPAEAADDLLRWQHHIVSTWLDQGMIDLAESQLRFLFETRPDQGRYLEMWKEILSEGMARVASEMVNPLPPADHMRRCSPFGSLLPQSVAWTGRDRVLFLDFDGVLNHTLWDGLLPIIGVQNARQAYRFTPFDPACCQRVSQLVEDVDADIVISSDWRGLLPFRELRLLLEMYGFNPDRVQDTTLRFGEKEVEYLYGERLRLSIHGRDVANWIARRATPRLHCVAVDDSPRGFAGSSSFVQTDEATGFTDQDSERCTALFALSTGTRRAPRSAPGGEEGGPVAPRRGAARPSG